MIILWGFTLSCDGVTDAQIDLNISHTTIKKCADIGANHNGYIFNYERINYERIN